MKRLSTTLFLALVPAALLVADHHESDLAKKLDEALAGISQPDEAQRYDPRMAVQALTSAASAPNSEIRDPYVGLLLERLEAEETSQAAKAWIIHQLENVGRAEAVPALTKLMGSPFHHLRDLARRALEQNPSKEAGAALRTLVMEEQDPDSKRALVHSLGQRADAEATELAASLLEAKAPELRAEAIEALGKIASEDAVAALKGAYENAEPKEMEVRQRLADALLEAARRLTPEHPENAGAILETLYQIDQPPHVQAAAFRGLLAVDPDEAENLVLLALQSRESHVREAAISACRGLEEESVIPNVLAVKLPELSEQEQSLALAVLADSGDSTVASQLAETLGSGKLPAEREKEVISVLGQLGGIEAAQRLLERAGLSGDDGEREAARDALSRMPGEGVDALLMAESQRGDISCRTEAVRALAGRSHHDAVPLLFLHVEEGPKKMRQVSLEALGELVTPAEISQLVKHAGADGGGDAMRAVMQACRRAQGSEEAVGAVLELMGSMDAAGKEELLPCLGILGGEKALEAVRELTRDGELGRAAMRTLSIWSGPEAGPVLLDLAGAEDLGNAERTLALRGLSRLLGNREREIDRGQRLEFAMKGLELAQRPEDRRLFLPVLGTLGTRSPEALEVLMGLLDDQELAEEAALAALSAVENMRGRRGNRVKQQTLKAVIRAEIGADTVERAQKMLDEL